MSISKNFDNELFSSIGKNLYLDPGKADVFFIFASDDERVPAHKAILSSASDVFERMFYGLLKEEGDIKIHDSTAQGFKEFLRFFYFNKVDVSMEHVADIMYLGAKYNVAECHRLCVTLLETNMTEQTVITALELTILHEQPQLQKSCESFIASNSYQFFKSKSFLTCDRRVLEHIIKMGCLSCSEPVMFEACMLWVKENSNEAHLTRDIVQTQLGNLFYEIRFGSMTFEEFAKLLPVYGELFSSDEYSEILQLISGQIGKPKLFKACRRSLAFHSHKLILCNRLKLDTAIPPKYGLLKDNVTKFSTNTCLMLGYFVIDVLIAAVGFVRKPIANTGNVTIIMANSRKILTQFSCTLGLDDDGYKINLPAPISIRPDTIYVIVIKFPFPTSETFSIWTNLSPTVNMGSGIVVNFHNDNNGRNLGLIRSLGFHLLSEHDLPEKS